MKQAASIHDLDCLIKCDAGPWISISTTAEDYAPIKQMQVDQVRWH